MTSRAECSPRKIRRIQKKNKEGDDEKKDGDKNNNDGKKENVDDTKDNKDKDNVSNDNVNKDKGDKDNGDKDNGDKDNGDKGNDDEESKEDLVYGFYRLIIHPMILRLKSQKDKLNYSHWLTKLDECEDPDYKMPLIKMLFISLKNNRTFNLYAEPPVDDLSELNLDFGDTTMDMLRKAQETTNEYYILDNENLLQETQHKRSAAVATDMCSYIASKTSRYLVQSFYVRSEFPIQTWYNPAGIMVPKNIDHNQWELYLNRFNLLADEGLFAFTEPHANTCESIMNLDQVPKELNPACIFRWHPHSVLYSIDRPKRSAGFMDTDQDISTQPISQQHIDESAFTIVHKKSFPGYKILNPRTYSTLIMPDPDFVFNMTGVRITYNNVSHISGTGHEKAGVEVPIECQSKYQMLPTKSCSADDDEKKSIWVKPNKPCSTKTTLNKKDFQKSAISSNSTECQQRNTVKSNNNLKSNEQKKTSNKCDDKPLTNSKFVNKNVGSECSSKSKKSCDQNMSSKTPNSCSCNNRCKQFSNNQLKVQNNKQCNISSMNDTSNWKSIEILSVKNAPPICSNRCKEISIEPKNSKVQCSGQSTKKSNNKNYEESCNYDRINQRDSKSKQSRINKQDNTGKYNESFSKSSTSGMNECSDSNEKLSRSKYDENSDREMSDYFEFGSGESIACTGKSRSIQQGNTKSFINLPTNQNILSSDESYNSGCSTGTGINESFSCQTYSNSSDSLSTLTSDFSSNVTYPDHELDFPTRSTKYSNNGNKINRDYSGIDDFYDSLHSTDYTNEGIQCPFNNSKRDNSNSNRSQSEEYQNSMQSYNKDYNTTDNNIEDMSFPQTSYEESCSSTSLNNSSRDLENMSMPSISYETSCSDNASFDD